MNLAQFFAHWSIEENPFRGEEARHDSVFARVGVEHEEAAPAAPRVIREDGAAPAPASVKAVPSVHSDFEKIVGDLARPSTAVVFGEKGSGKTAIRMQIADRVARRNKRYPDARTLVIAYDELNGFLDQVCERDAGKRRDPLETFKSIRLVDHMDAILAIGTGRISSALIGGAGDPPPADLGTDPVRAARQMSPGLKTDLLLLQALYDRADIDGRRTARMRAKLRLPPPGGRLLWLALAWIGWLPAAGAGALLLFGGDVVRSATLAVEIALGVLVVLWLGVLAKVLVWDRFVLGRLGAKLWRQLRFLSRQPDAYASALVQLEPMYRTGAFLPLTNSDEHRYAMLDRLLRVLAHFGYTGALVVMDRVDEPTLVNGDPDRMRAIVWPLFNNKFLQQDRLGIKLLLPIELRHALFKESSAFFQEARLDKQNLVERLSWTGPMLYDLCNARLAACRSAGADPVSLRELFAEDVSRQDLVDALDQMHQPRDAFKFLYRCLTEHCSNVTAEQEDWRIPRLVLDQVRRAEADRVQQLYRGIRPA
ncbi:MAG: hypothetical protein R3B49_07175 [Phycisphaerales bacterium]